MSKDKNTKVIVHAATVKITKGQIDQARAHGITHANFTNKGVQKRLMKNQERIRREQERRENAIKKLNKALTRARKEGELPATARFVDKEGNQIPRQPVDPIYDTIGQSTLNKSIDESLARLSASKTNQIANATTGEETGIDPSLPFADGTIDTNVDPKNFGVQSVDNEAEENKFQGMIGDTEVSTQYQNTNVAHDLKGWISELPPHIADTLKDIASLYETPTSEKIEALRASIGNLDVNDSYPEKFDWDGLRKEIKAEGGLTHSHLVAELPLVPPMQVMDGFTNGVEPMCEMSFKTGPGDTEINNQYLNQSDALDLKDEITKLPTLQELYEKNGGRGFGSKHRHTPTESNQYFEGRENIPGLDPWQLAPDAPRKQMFASTHAQSFNSITDEEGVSLTQEQINDHFHHHSKEDGPFCHAKFAIGIDGYKFRNSSLSGAILHVDAVSGLDKAAFNANLPQSVNPTSPLFHPKAHETLTAMCRAESVPGNLCPEVIDPNKNSEDLEKAAAWSKERGEIYDREMARRNSEKENKEDDGGAGDNSFSLNP